MVPPDLHVFVIFHTADDRAGDGGFSLPNLSGISYRKSANGSTLRVRRTQLPELFRSIGEQCGLANILHAYQRLDGRYLFVWRARACP
jgi:hypothetical protein